MFISFKKLLKTKYLSLEGEGINIIIFFIIVIFFTKIYLKQALYFERIKIFKNETWYTHVYYYY